MKTRLSAVAIAALLLAGCAVPAVNVVAPGTGATPAKPGTTLTDPKTGKAIPNQAVEPLNGIAFKPLTSSNAQFVGSGNGLVAAGGLNGSGNGLVAAGGGNALGAGAMAPTAASAPARAASNESMADASFAAPSSAGSMVAAGGGMADGMAMTKGGSTGPTSGGGAFSGNVWSNYGFGYYFGGGGGMGEQMALVSLQEAETKGSTGSFQEIVGGIAAPVVKAWAPDARLVESGSTLDNDGKLFVDSQPQDGGVAMDTKMAMMPMPGPGYGGYDPNAAWRLVYASSERHEVLQFTVKADKTTIIRMRWSPLDLAPERVLTDSASAVRAVLKAVTDKGFKGEEEKSGLDYFLGFKYEQPQTNQWDGDYQKTEVLYEVPKDARWNVTLTQVMGKLVWDLNWNAPWNQPTIGIGVPTPVMAMAEPAVARAMPASMDGEDVAMPISARPECAPNFKPEPNFYINYWGQAMVDAETGAVIRFSRPTKVTYNYPQPDYDCAVAPMPGEKPTPVEPPVEDNDQTTETKKLQ